MTVLVTPPVSPQTSHLLNCSAPGSDLRLPTLPVLWGGRPAAAGGAFDITVVFEEVLILAALLAEVLVVGVEEFDAEFYREKNNLLLQAIFISIQIYQWSCSRRSGYIRAWRWRTRKCKIRGVDTHRLGEFVTRGKGRVSGRRRYRSRGLCKSWG